MSRLYPSSPSSGSETLSRRPRRSCHNVRKTESKPDRKRKTGRKRKRDRKGERKRDRDRQLSRLTKLGFRDFVKEAEEVLSESKVN